MVDPRTLTKEYENALDGAASSYDAVHYIIPYIKNVKTTANGCVVVDFEVEVTLTPYGKLSKLEKDILEMDISNKLNDVLYYKASSTTMAGNIVITYKVARFK